MIKYTFKDIPKDVLKYIILPLRSAIMIYDLELLNRIRITDNIFFCTNKRSLALINISISRSKNITNFLYTEVILDNTIYFDKLLICKVKTIRNDLPNTMDKNFICKVNTISNDLPNTMDKKFITGFTKPETIYIILNRL